MQFDVAVADSLGNINNKEAAKKGDVVRSPSGDMLQLSSEEESEYMLEKVSIEVELKINRTPLARAQQHQLENIYKDYQSI